MICTYACMYVFIYNGSDLLPQQRRRWCDNHRIPHLLSSRWPESIHTYSIGRWKAIVCMYVCMYTFASHLNQQRRKLFTHSKDMRKENKGSINALYVCMCSTGNKAKQHLHRFEPSQCAIICTTPGVDLTCGGVYRIVDTSASNAIHFLVPIKYYHIYIYTQHYIHLQSCMSRSVAA